MIFYLIFAICAFYEDIRSILDKLKGLDVDDDPIEIEFKEDFGMSFSFDGRWMEFIYIIGVWLGSMFAPERILFIVILLMSAIPKKNLLWIIIDSVISIILISFITFSHYLHY